MSSMLFIFVTLLRLGGCNGDDVDDSFPVLDIGAFVEGSPEEKQEWGRKFYDVLTTYGFYYLTNHSIPEELISSTFRSSEDFFALPQEEKEKHRKQMDEDLLWGYLPLRTECLRDKPDVKELFDFNVTSLDARYPDSYFKDQDVGKFIYAVKELSQTVLEAYAIALNLEEDFFSKHFEWKEDVERTGYFTMIKYPPLPEDSDDTKTPPHTDSEAITLIFQDDSGGLQAWHNTANKWVDLTPIPGTAVVNTGNLLQRWTNDVLVSTVHQVHPHVSNKDRYSLVFFTNPNAETVIDPKDVLPDQEPKHEPVLVSDIYASRISELYDVPDGGRADMVIDAQQSSETKELNIDGCECDSYLCDMTAACL